MIPMANASCACPFHCCKDSESDLSDDDGGDDKGDKGSAALLGMNKDCAIAGMLGSRLFNCKASLSSICGAYIYTTV